MLHMDKPIIIIRIDNSEILPLPKDIKHIIYKGNVELIADEISSALGAL